MTLQDDQDRLDREFDAYEFEANLGEQFDWMAQCWEIVDDGKNDTR